MVIAITTMTLLLSLSLSISNIVLRQIKITNVNNSSKPAFFTADSAAECAFYNDTRFVASSTDPSVNMNSIDSFNTSIFGNIENTATIPTDVKCGNGVKNVNKVLGTKTITNFDIDYGDSCAKVTVEKTDVDTKIIARGYNTKADQNGCDLSNVSSRRLVERGLTIKY